MEQQTLQNPLKMRISHLMQSFFLQETFHTSQCPLDLPLTCQNETSIDNSCCFEFPGGIFMQTQFWNSKPSKRDLNETEIVKELGPLDSFTVHGLWPDNCDGSYEQFCDSSLFIDDLYYLLNKDKDGKRLYEQLGKYWKSNIVGDDESLWIHEFNKHGSCIKTLRPDCQIKGSKRQTVMQYFNITMNLFHKLDTYQILKSNNITPSIEQTYSKKEIENALRTGFNEREVLIKCNNKNELQEIWYYHLLNGTILNEEFSPINSISKVSNCHPNNIKFYPKGYFPKGSNPPGNGGRNTKGILYVTNVNNKNDDDSMGAIVRNGHWLIKGSGATFQLIPSQFGNFLLKSRNGWCQIIQLPQDNDENSKHNDLLNCNQRNSKFASQFDFDKDTGLIGFSNTFKWGAQRYPRGRRQSLVYHINDDNKDLPIKFNIKFESK